MLIVRPLRVAAITGSAILAVGGFPLLATSAQAAPHAAAKSCPPAKHTYIDAQGVATDHTIYEVSGHAAKYHCGGEDDYHYSESKSSEVVTLSQTVKITVFKNPGNPDKTRTIKPSQLAHWLKKNSSEPIYRITGSKNNVKTMTEEFHP